MVRVGGMSYTIDPSQKIGYRISNMYHHGSGDLIEYGKKYVVGGWASVNPDTKGPPVYEIVSDYISKEKTVSFEPKDTVKILGI